MPGYYKKASALISVIQRVILEENAIPANNTMKRAGIILLSMRGEA